jgi:hypothetical protein
MRSVALARRSHSRGAGTPGRTRSAEVSSPPPPREQRGRREPEASLRHFSVHPAPNVSTGRSSARPPAGASGSGVGERMTRCSVNRPWGTIHRASAPALSLGAVLLSRNRFEFDAGRRVRMATARAQALARSHSNASGEATSRAGSQPELRFDPLHTPRHPSSSAATLERVGHPLFHRSRPRLTSAGKALASPADAGRMPSTSSCAGPEPPARRQPFNEEQPNPLLNSTPAGTREGAPPRCSST